MMWPADYQMGKEMLRRYPQGGRGPLDYVIICFYLMLWYKEPKMANVSLTSDGSDAPCKQLPPGIAKT